ncbi:MAG TPA: GNAT family N-acetyltransferase [Terriglobales bacterium]|nr:GNAT family N-acetyltransferase [Terriglobales bacterium]
MLRRFVPEDRDGFIEMNRDPGVRKYFPGLLTPKEYLGEMTSVEQHWDAHGFGPWALDVGGDFAGIPGLKWVSPGMPFAPAPLPPELRIAASPLFADVGVRRPDISNARLRQGGRSPAMAVTMHIQNFGSGSI